MRDEESRLLGIMKSFDTAMVTLRESNGALRARHARLAHVGEHGEIWLAVMSDDGELPELAHDPRVAITVQDGVKFASLSGRAQVVRSPGRAVELWQDAWRAWFPEGPHDARLVLLRIRGEAAEYWDHSDLDESTLFVDSLRASVVAEVVRPDAAAPVAKHLN